MFISKGQVKLISEPLYATGVHWYNMMKYIIYPFVLKW